MASLGKTKRNNELGRVAEQIPDNLNDDSYDDLSNQTNSLAQHEQQLRQQRTNLIQDLQSIKSKRDQLQAQIDSAKGDRAEAGTIKGKAEDFIPKMKNAKSKLENLSNSDFPVIRNKAQNLKGKVGNALNTLRGIRDDMSEFISEKQQDINSLDQQIDSRISAIKSVQTQINKLGS